MSTTARFAEIAALAGDPSRAAILHALMDGRALTATELARAAGISPQTASGHLSRLINADLLGVSAQGRHRYYRLANPAVATMIEGIMQVAGSPVAARPALKFGPRDGPMRAARTCYDHLAGRLGVALADSLVAKGWLHLDHEAGLLSEAGLTGLQDLGVLPLSPFKARRSAGTHAHATPRFCRPCLDWSERRLHLAGKVGGRLAIWAFDKGWVRRVSGTRAVTITPIGARGFRDTFGVQFTDP